MSGQWEVVGKKKDKGNKVFDQKSGKETSKKKTENVNVKVEEVLAKSQVRNLYLNDKNKENKPLEKKTQEVVPKKTQKKQEKSQEPLKAKSPKSLESALNHVSASEFKSIFEKSRSYFPDAPIVWLKELTQFLNQKVSVELQDPVFTTKPQSFPLSIVPSGIKAVIEKATMDADKSNMQLFFDISLTSMATDMSKNLPAVGHKLFLQYIALNEPSLVVANLMKHVVLRNSYQNRPNIGLSILWAVGQVGINDFQAGLKVFQDLMLPLIEQKNYSRYIIKYLLNLINNSKEISLTKEQYLLILETVFVAKKNFPSDLKQDLIHVIPSLTDSLFGEIHEEILSSLIEWSLKKITLNNNSSYQDCLCEVLIECFYRNQVSLENWSKIYNKNAPSSAILLKYIDKNWKNISIKLNKKAFIHTLNEINLINNELLLKKRKEECLTEVTNIIENLLEKMADTRKPRSSFKLLFIISLIMLGLVYYDINQEGSWQKSRTRKALKDLGICEYTYKVFDAIKRGLWWADEHINENFPEYRKSIVEFLESYIELTSNLGHVFYNIAINIKELVLEKYPVVLQSIESHAPGLVEQSQNAVNNVWSSSLFYFNRSIDYLRNEIFVGQLSPENVQRVVFEALNTTQIKASEYYHWLYEKVQTTIK